MNTYRQATTTHAPRSRAGTGASLLVVCLFGILPFGLVSGLMLMQILGVWSY